MHIKPVTHVINMETGERVPVFKTEHYGRGVNRVFMVGNVPVADRTMLNSEEMTVGEGTSILIAVVWTPQGPIAVQKWYPNKL